ncbi:hypothetical protein D3C80_2031530 [compost metagenome]
MASTAPIALDTSTKPPASRKIRHISTTLWSPMPDSSVSSGLRPRRQAMNAASAKAGRIATGARS